MRKYDEYKESVIPWLDKIPVLWEEKRAKYLFNKENRPVQPEDEVVTCFRDGTVTLRKNRRTEGFTESFKEIGYQGIKKGDLVIHQMDAFAGSTGVSDSDGKATPVYHVCTPKNDNVNNSYYAFVIRMMGLNGFIQSLYRGIRERSSDFRYDVFGKQYLPVPSIQEQNRIVDYLIDKSSEIENLISKTEREIELLKELKQSVVAHAVTKGLNPNAKMKDSGIGWIGEIPEHWEVRKLFQICTEYYVSNKGMINDNLLSLSYGAIVPKDINKTEGLLPTSFETYQIVKPNIIVLRLTDLQNDHKSLRVGICKEVGIVTSAYLSLCVRESNDANYMYFQLHINDIHKVFYGMGDGLRQSLNYDGLKYLKMIVPPSAEQKEIVEYIDYKTTQIDKMIVELTYKVEYLKQYKQRLIADVVTGKINVQPE